MLCARFLRPHADETHGRLYNMFESAFNPGAARCERPLGWPCGRMRSRLLFSAILVRTVLLFRTVPKGLFPGDDSGLLSATAEAAQGTIVQRDDAAAALAAARFAKGHQRRRLSRRSADRQQGNLNIVLKPAGQRPPADVMVQQLTSD